MHMAEATCICIVWYKRTKELESRSQCLNRLEKLIFPMYFLKADDVVVFDQSAAVVMFLFHGNL